MRYFNNIMVRSISPYLVREVGSLGSKNVGPLLAGLYVAI